VVVPSIRASRHRRSRRRRRRRRRPSASAVQFDHRGFLCDDRTEHVADLTRGHGELDPTHGDDDGDPVDGTDLCTPGGDG